MTTIVEIHAIQSLGPNNINRDDTGTPKNVRIGGVPRARVSSQCWKHAIREKLGRTLGEEHVAIRTKEIADRLTKSMLKLDPELDPDKARQTSLVIGKFAGLIPSERKKQDEDDSVTAEALAFIGNETYDELARFGLAHLDDGKLSADTLNKAKKDLTEILRNDKAVDLALFGRMAASNTKLNVNANCQVAHAVGVDRLNMEDDFYTAVDEWKTHSDNAKDEGNGAGMVGDIEFSSSTVYRFASLSVDGLLHQLQGDKDLTLQAIAAFIEAFATSMPTGNLNTFANHLPPNYLAVIVRDSQPVSLVDAFNKPVSELPIPENAAVAMARREIAYEKAYSFLTPKHTWLVSVDDAPAQLKDAFGDPIDGSRIGYAVAEYLTDKLNV